MHGHDEELESLCRGPEVTRRRRTWTVHVWRKNGSFARMVIKGDTEKTYALTMSEHEKDTKAIKPNIQW